MAVNPSTFGPCPQFENAAGEPAVGDKLFFYAAGTTTKLNTYTNSTGNVANTNPVVLNALGQPSTEIWFNNGDLYKMVWAPSTDTDPPTNPIRTFDNLRGINDTTAAAAASEWILSASAPTYVSATSFTVTGNQTATFTPGRRLKTTNTSGTIYSTISTSVYGVLTTITVVNDSGALDSGLSDVSYGILNPALRSYPANGQETRIDVASAATVDLTTLAPGTRNIRITGATGPITQFTVATGLTYFVSFSGAPIITNNANIVTNTGTNIQIAAGDSCIIRATAANVVEIISFERGLHVNQSQIQSMPDPTLAANAMTLPASTHSLDFRSATLTTGLTTTVSGTAAALVIPSGATLGTVAAVQSEIVEVIMNNGGTLEKAVVNISGGNDLSETGVISTTAIDTASDSANVFYSNTARSNLAYRVVRRITSTQATPGTWVTNPSLVQGAGGQALTAMSSLGYGQTWQDVSGSRAFATTYYNTTGKSIAIHVNGTSAAIGASFSINVSGVAVSNSSQAYGAAVNIQASALIPPGASYSLTNNFSSVTVTLWRELR